VLEAALAAATSKERGEELQRGGGNRGVSGAGITSSAGLAGTGPANRIRSAGTLDGAHVLEAALVMGRR
jgi:hypothetical protein